MLSRKMIIIICKCFQKSVNRLRKKVIWHINDNFSDFFSDNESDEEQIKAIRLMIFERTILKMYFLREQLKEPNEE